ncbi:MAG: cofactor-independent phosphoglycerate mutase [Candidatus Omnitrophica bacterium]|nr:cofactor-independent phosphoglycerate mutase [Candidatus Omnitrophota bacterium]MCM8828240.1 cofactor-independent phosphoglycerate mutase [Candidatus Omnitrophota bacterium]
MKYLILVPDGVADLPVKELNNKTPLEVARKPNIDNLTKIGCSGLMETIPDGFPAGSEVANLSILGYSPKKYYQGRGSLEAASLGINLESDDLVFRCNTVFVENGIMISHSAGHITSEESEELIEFLNVKLSSQSIKFYHGLDYRHILVLKGQFSPEVECFPPHDNVRKSVNSILPKGLSGAGEKTAETLRYLIKESEALLKNHPVNLKRIASEKQPGNLIWPWSPGRKPSMEPISKKFGITGAVISAVDLVKGIGIYAGFDVINVKGATGLYNTNYEGKAYAAIEALNKYDLVYVHVEAPDEAAHEGNLKLKIKCIEDFDAKLVGIIVKNVDLNKTCIAVVPDHFTPVSQRSHSNQKVPFVIYRPDLKPDHISFFSEKECADGAFGVIKEDMFIKILLGKSP